MKKALVTCSVISLISFSSSQAAVIFSEDFTQADGQFSDRAASSGAGFIDVAGGSALTIVNNAFVLTSNGGGDRVEFESTAQATTGFFEFDFTIVEAMGPGTLSDRGFIQLVSGDSRSTGGSPVANLSDTLEAGTVGIVDGVTSTVRYYFNTTTSDFVYTDPAGVSQTLEAGGYDFFVDNVLTQEQQSQSANSAGLPASIDTLVVQTFAAQEGVSITLDNVSFNAITTIPEPSTTVLFGLASLGFFVRRR